jgi:hypothetical protein
MKNTILFVLSLAPFFAANAQLKVTPKCTTMTVDVLNGKVNDVKPNFNNEQIKAKLPCYTNEEPENSSSKCGGLVAYNSWDIKFYTGRDYVEIGPNFKGKLTLPLMGGKRGSFFRLLGNPVLKDEGWDAFETQYGCLILYYNGSGKVRMIRFSTKPTDHISLCE